MCHKFCLSACEHADSSSTAQHSNHLVEMVRLDIFDCCVFAVRCCLLPCFRVCSGNYCYYSIIVVILNLKSWCAALTLSLPLSLPPSLWDTRCLDGKFKWRNSFIWAPSSCGNLAFIQVEKRQCFWHHNLWGGRGGFTKEKICSLFAFDVLCCAAPCAFIILAFYYCTITAIVAFKKKNEKPKKEERKQYAIWQKHNKTLLLLRVHGSRAILCLFAAAAAALVWMQFFYPNLNSCGPFHFAFV